MLSTLWTHGTRACASMLASGFANLQRMGASATRTMSSQVFQKQAIARAMALTAIVVTVGLPSKAFADLVAYWNFSNATSQTTLETVSSGSGTLTSDAAVAGTAGGAGRTVLGGTTANEIAPTDTNSNAWALVGNANNGKFIQFQVSMTGRSNLILTFATRGTSTGFASNQVSYSTNNVSFTNFGSTYSMTSTTYATRTIDLSSITALNDAASVYVRITFDGATGSSGNNRIDNVQFNASTLCTAPPAPPGTTAYTTAVGVPVTMSVSVGANQTADWFTTSCGVGAAPGGSGTTSLTVAPTATGATTYFARARNTGSCTDVGASCLTITLTTTAGITDASASGPTIDGGLGAAEYGPANSYRWVGGGAGYGGVLGNGSIYLESDSTGLTVGYRLGATLNDVVVVLLDTAAGGFTASPTGLGDTQAIGRVLTNTTLPISPEFAIAFRPNGQAAYSLTGNAANGVALDAEGGTGNGANDFREVRLSWATLDIAPGATVKFVAGLASATAYLSNESIPASASLNSGANPDNNNSGVYDAAGQFTTYACPAVTIDTQPTQNTNPVCTGAGVSYTVAASGGSGTVSYLWKQSTDNFASNDDDASGANTSDSYSPPTASAGTMYYRCEVSSTCGSPSSATSNTVTLTVNAVPGTPTSPAATTSSFCSASPPGSITLSATLDGGTSIDWFTGSCGGTPVVPSFSTATTAIIAPPGSTTTYYARATDGTCSSASCAEVTVTVFPSTVIGTQPGNQSACIGGNASFTVAATGTGLSYQWYRGASPLSNGGSISGATTDTLTITGVVSGDADSYSVDVMSASCATVPSASRTLTVVSPPSAGLSVTAQAAEVCGGSGTDILVAASESGISYQLRNSAGNVNVGAAVPGTGGTISLPTGNLTTTPSVTFNVLATASGCTAAQLAQTATVTVNALPATPTGSATYSGPAGSTVLMTVSVGGGQSADWSTTSCGGAPVPGGTDTVSLSVTIPPYGSPATYHVQARDSTTGCKSTGCLTITVSATSPIIINEVQADTPGTDTMEFIELYDGGLGNTPLNNHFVVFYNGSNDLSYKTIDLLGKSTNADGYFVIGDPGLLTTLPGSFAANNTLTITPDGLQNGQDAIALYTGSASSIPDGSAPTTTNLLDAVVYDTSDPDDPGLAVLVNAGQPQINQNGSGDSGGNHSIQRCPNGSGGARNTNTYAASLPTPGAPNTFTITPTTPAATPSSICAAGSSTLTASGVGPDNVIDWHSGSCTGPLEGTGTSLPVSPGTTTDYYAVTRNSNSGCIGGCAAAVTVSINAATTTTDPSPSSQCSGSTTMFSVTGGGTGTLTYQWEESTSGAGGPWGPASGTNADTDTLTTSGAAADGTLFRCTVTGACGSATSNPAALTVNACPVDCVVSAWSPWGACSLPCGGGTQIRTRTIITPASNGGMPCPVLEETQPCNTQPCPVDCVVSGWSEWSACSVACGGGTRTRTRTIITPASNGGAVCPTLEETEPCNTQSCDPLGACCVGTSCSITTEAACTGLWLGANTLCTTASITVELAGVDAGPFDRCITFDFYTAASCPNPAYSVERVLTFSGGSASTSFATIPCGTYTGVGARDRLHTLRRVASGAPAFDATNPYALSTAFTATNSKPLIGGNVNDDAYIDILDFGGYIGRLSQSPGADTTCSTSPLHPDFSGDGTVFTEDFTFIQNNFAVPRDPTPCSPLAGDGAPITDISVADLIARGDWDIARADLNLDGRLNTLDATFLAAHGLPACAADFNHTGGLDVQDIFDFINAWMSGHPAADIDRDHLVAVPDIFQYLTAWFAGCP